MLVATHDCWLAGAHGSRTHVVHACRLHELFDQNAHSGIGVGTAIPSGSGEGSVAGLVRCLAENLRAFAKLADPEDDVVAVLGRVFAMKAAGNDVFPVRARRPSSLLVVQQPLHIA